MGNCNSLAPVNSLFRCKTTENRERNIQLRWMTCNFWLFSGPDLRHWATVRPLAPPWTSPSPPSPPPPPPPAAAAAASSFWRRFFKRSASRSCDTRTERPTRSSREGHAPTNVTSTDLPHLSAQIGDRFAQRCAQRYLTSKQTKNTNNPFSVPKLHLPINSTPIPLNPVKPSKTQ